MTHGTRPQDRAGRARRSPLVLVVLAALALSGVVMLTGLGWWQLERRAWKLQLIEQVDQRIHAAAVAAPGPDRWPRINATDDVYRKVTATGQFLHDRETLVQAVSERGGGFWVLTPFRTTDGFTFLVNRGFVPPERRDAATRRDGQMAGPANVTGLIRMTEPGGGFLRSNDPAADRWYSRDVAAIAAARNLPNVAPFFIDADAAPNPGALPVGGLTVISFPNNHLVYAFTWFGLAIVVIGGAAIVARDEWRFRRKSLNSGCGQAPCGSRSDAAFS